MYSKAKDNQVRNHAWSGLWGSDLRFYSVLLLVILGFAFNVGLGVFAFAATDSSNVEVIKLADSETSSALGLCHKQPCSNPSQFTDDQSCEYEEESEVHNQQRFDYEVVGNIFDCLPFSLYHVSSGIEQAYCQGFMVCLKSVILRV